MIGLTHSTDLTRATDAEILRSIEALGPTRFGYALKLSLSDRDRIARLVGPENWAAIEGVLRAKVRSLVAVAAVDELRRLLGR